MWQIDNGSLQTREYWVNVRTLCFNPRIKLHVKWYNVWNIQWYLGVE